jgi:hypothetical protein
MAIVLDGTAGITSPAETIQGNLTTTGNTILGDASTDTLNVGNGGLVKDASGNVGIGTASPSTSNTAGASFVPGTSTVASMTGSNGSGQLLLGNNGNGSNLAVNDSCGMIAFKGRFNSTFGGGNDIASIIGTYTGNGTTRSGAIRFLTLDSGTEAERMRIDSSGNLLVGTTSALGAGITVQTGSNTQQLILRYSANAAGKYYYLGSWSNNGSSFVIQSSAGYGVTLGSETATSWSTYSDIRLKTISGRIENALFGVMQLEPIKFSWKRDESNKPQVGISAQSVLPVLPEAVDEAEDFSNPDSTDKYLTVRYTELIPLLTAAIQEQQAMIDELKAKVAALEAA